MRIPLLFSMVVLLVIALTPLMRKLAAKLGMLDVPGGRKIHSEATPLLGGLAIYLGFLAGILLRFHSLIIYLPIFISASFIMIVGLIDDYKGLSATSRMVCQLLAALFIIYFGFRVSFIPSGFLKDPIEVLITLIWILGVTNAYNYLDGLNGLAPGSAILNLFCFWSILNSTKQYALELVVITLLGACLGFIFYNNPRKANIFLGDAGSTFLGFMLASISLMGDWASNDMVKLSIPILILGVPIFDMIFTTVMRIREEKIKTIVEWLRYGGRDHFHHYLVDLGLLPSGAVIFIYFVTLSLGISAIMISNDMEAWLTLSQSTIIFGVIATLMVVGKRRHSGWRRQESNGKK